MLLVLAGLTLSLAAQPQEIYRWIDKDGQVHYSDQPGAPNAERVILADPNAYESEPSFGDYAPAASAPEDTDTDEVAAYESLAIVQPTPDQVFFGADATVVVAAELGGTLRPDHTVVFFVNGNRRPAGSGLTLELQNLDRGSHFLRAAVLDQNGDPVITSQQITFHVREPSINTPQSPQARPKPAPRPRPTPAT
ncbi:MAG: DUF4124 domain-containing protein [Steroidobacteraceae bacterium]